MKRYFCLVLLFIFIQQGLMAQTDSYSKEVFVNGTDSLLYRLLLPENFDPAVQYPVVIFLHGAGERGSDNEKQLLHGGNLFQSDQLRKSFPAIVIFPQCPVSDFWANVQIKNTGERFKFQKGGQPTRAMGLLISFMKQLRSLKYTDNDRFYIGGLSMGGMGTLEMIRRKPKGFAAAFAICGGGHVENVKRYKRMPLWLFHGELDNVVPAQRSKDIAAERHRLKFPAKLTIYPQANHNSWDATFAEPQLLPWLFSHSR